MAQRNEFKYSGILNSHGSRNMLNKSFKELLGICSMSTKDYTKKVYQSCLGLYVGIIVLSQLYVIL